MLASNRSRIRCVHVTGFDDMLYHGGLARKFDTCKYVPASRGDCKLLLCLSSTNDGDSRKAVTSRAHYWISKKVIAAKWIPCLENAKHRQASIHVSFNWCVVNLPECLSRRSAPVLTFLRCSRVTLWRLSEVLGEDIPRYLYKILLTKTNLLNSQRKLQCRLQPRHKLT